MARKFQFNDSIGFFEIDPMHVAAGLAEAAKQKHTAIRITPTDYRSDRLAFDAAALAGQGWIRKLIIDTSDEAPLNLDSLQKLTQLEELTVTEWAPLDFSKFSRLKELVLLRGTALPGLEAVRSLESLYLIDWKPPRLPADLLKLTASRLRISTSNVVDIAPAFKLPVLSALTLQHLPKLDVGSGLLQLDALQTLELEAVPWTDLGNLHSKALEELRLLNPVESLAFIRQLPNLRLLLVDNVKDGNMAPVLAHPALKEVHLTVARKHYTHKQKDLQAALQGGDRGIAAARPTQAAKPKRAAAKRRS